MMVGPCYELDELAAERGESTVLKFVRGDGFANEESVSDEATSPDNSEHVA